MKRRSEIFSEGWNKIFVYRGLHLIVKDTVRLRLGAFASNNKRAGPEDLDLCGIQNSEIDGQRRCRQIQTPCSRRFLPLWANAAALATHCIRVLPLGQITLRTYLGGGTERKISSRAQITAPTIVRARRCRRAVRTCTRCVFSGDLGGLNLPSLAWCAR